MLNSIEEIEQDVGYTLSVIDHINDIDEANRIKQLLKGLRRPPFKRIKSKLESQIQILNVRNIERDVRRIRQCKTEECVASIRRGYRRAPLITAAAKEQSAYIASTNRHHTRCNSLSSWLIVLWTQIKSFQSEPYTIELVKHFGRHIGNALHDMPQVWTGFCSVSALAEIEKHGISSKTNEHFIPRQYAGQNIVEQAARTDVYSMEDMANSLMEVTRVHWVTAEENSQLQQYQGADVFTDWKSTYSRANIELVDASENFPKQYDTAREYQLVWKSVYTQMNWTFEYPKT